MRLVANKPCSFGGKKFLIGDEVPANLVLNPNKQIKMGTLSKLTGSADAEPLAKEDLEAAVTPLKYTLPILKEDGGFDICVTNEELVVFAEIRQNPGKKAEDKKKIENAIKEITSNDLLIMLDALDGRSFVTGPVMDRVKELATNEEIEDTEDEESTSNVEDTEDKEDTSNVEDTEETPEGGE